MILITTYPPERLRVSGTAYPNGSSIDYAGNGREQYHLLPSNHPIVLAEAIRRFENTPRKPRTLIEDAKAIIDMTSKRLGGGYRR